MAKHIFLTGNPGVGKTTCLLKVLEKVEHAAGAIELTGFITQEFRQDGKRIGFDIVSYDSSTLTSSPSTLVPLARIGTMKPTIGKYSVQVNNIKRYATTFQPPLSPSSCSSAPPHLSIIDEIGKMELLCKDFFAAVIKHLDETANSYEESSVNNRTTFPSRRKTIILGTVPLLRQNNNKKALKDHYHRQVELVKDRPDVMVLLVTKSNRNQLTIDLVEYILSKWSHPEKDFTQILAPHRQKEAETVSRKIKPRPSHTEVSTTPTTFPKQNMSNDKRKESKKGAKVSSSWSKPCGPLVHSRVPPKVLLVGETSSPQPKIPNWQYSERSMWKVLALLIHPPINKERYPTLQGEILGKGICIWDVLANVHVRKGKHSTEEEEEIPNGLVLFLQQHASIQAICFIGTKARKTFGKYFSEIASTTHLTLPRGDSSDSSDSSHFCRTIELIVLPSSSNSNTMPMDKKAMAWKNAFSKHIPYFAL